MNTSFPPAIVVEELDGRAAHAAIDGLADVLVDCVHGGASVSFMLPFPRDEALAFWRGVAARVECGDYALFVARDPDGTLQGTVQLHLAMPPNQPHRGEVAKLLVHRRARRRGIAEALMRTLESAALQRGKTLLVLDTASDDADRLYRRTGWQETGRVPGYALFPDGRYCDTTIFWKRLG